MDEKKKSDFLGDMTLFNNDLSVIEKKAVNTVNISTATRKYIGEHWNISGLVMSSPKTFDFSVKSKMVEKDGMFSEYTPISKDLGIIQNRFKELDVNIFRKNDMIAFKQTVKEALQLLTAFFIDDSSWYKIIYYTGLGQKNSGNWCFTDGFITIEQIVDLIKKYDMSNKTVYIISDCAHSGDWLKRLQRLKLKQKDFKFFSELFVQTSCSDSQIPSINRFRGYSHFTQVFCQKDVRFQSIQTMIKEEKDKNREFWEFMENPYSILSKGEVEEIPSWRPYALTWKEGKTQLLENSIQLDGLYKDFILFGHNKSDKLWQYLWTNSYFLEINVAGKTAKELEIESEYKINQKFNAHAKELEQQLEDEKSGATQAKLLATGIKIKSDSELFDLMSNKGQKKV